MRVQVTALRYWKSEHTEETCEDAAGANIASGLFAVADGAGTTLFSGLWANFLVQHFLRIPLLSNDPFETAWWVRLAQEQFKQQTPFMAEMSWNVQQKAQNQGSHATLAGLRIFAHEATCVQAELLACGDSCIFVSRPASKDILSFPLKHTEEFAQAPICIPSRAGAFSRYFHQCHRATLAFAPDDIVIMATDAVARWIVSAGNGRYSGQREALQEVTQQTTDSWAHFIQECRSNGEMVDDDSTALMIKFLPEGASAAISLGITVVHSQSVREERKQEFLQAYSEEHRERMALCFGDGLDLRAEGVEVSQENIMLARQIADAQQEVMAKLRQAVNNPNVVAIMTPVWQKHARLLYHEPCAANLRRTLSHLGIALEPITGASPLKAQKFAESVLQHNESDTTLLPARSFDLQEIQALPPDGQGEET